MRRVSAANREGGATAVMVAILMVPLLGFGALVVDVGALVQERRELQNGADAAALAVAKDCAGGNCGGFDNTAETFADANALDGDSNVDPGEVCGFGPGLPACSSPPSVPAGVSGYARVTARTREVSSGTNQITFTLARVLGFTGAPVNMRSVVAWGAVGAGTVIPLTISICEFNEFTNFGTNYASGPPFSGSPRKISFHKQSSVKCPPKSSSGLDLPGGFGWLDDGGGTCKVTISAGNWVYDKTGNSVKKECTDADFVSWRDTKVLIPIYDDIDGQGSNGRYHIAGFAELYIAGYKLSNQVRWPSSTTCPGPGNSGTCLVGYFVRFTTTTEGFGGQDFGVTVIKTIG